MYDTFCQSTYGRLSVASDALACSNSHTLVLKGVGAHSALPRAEVLLYTLDFEAMPVCMILIS